MLDYLDKKSKFYSGLLTEEQSKYRLKDNKIIFTPSFISFENKEEIDLVMRKALAKKHLFYKHNDGS